jgi:hypothetical protein
MQEFKMTADVCVNPVVQFSILLSTVKADTLKDRLLNHVDVNLHPGEEMPGFVRNSACGVRYRSVRG